MEFNIKKVNFKVEKLEKSSFSFSHVNKYKVIWEKDDKSGTFTCRDYSTRCYEVVEQLERNS